MRLFEEGIQLSNACKVELEKAEGRVQVLVETRGSGEVAEFEDELGRAGLRRTRRGWADRLSPPMVGSLSRCFRRGW